MSQTDARMATRLARIVRVPQWVLKTGPEAARTEDLQRAFVRIGCASVLN